MPHQLLLEVEYPAIAPHGPKHKTDSALPCRPDIQFCSPDRLPASNIILPAPTAHQIAQLTKDYARAIYMPATINDKPKTYSRAISLELPLY